MDIASELLIAAEHGDPTAQFDVGLYYYQGNVLPKDPIKAQEWWQKAAEANNPRAQCMLGNVAYGRKEFATAEKWWRLAAEAGEQMRSMPLGSIAST